MAGKINQPIIVHSITDLKSARAVLQAIKAANPSIKSIVVEDPIYNKIHREIVLGKFISGVHLTSDPFVLFIDGYHVYCQG